MQHSVKRDGNFFQVAFRDLTEEQARAILTTAFVGPKKAAREAEFYPHNSEKSVGQWLFGEPRPMITKDVATWLIGRNREDEHDPTF